MTIYVPIRTSMSSISYMMGRSHRALWLGPEPRGGTSLLRDRFTSAPELTSSVALVSLSKDI